LPSLRICCLSLLCISSLIGFCDGWAAWKSVANATVGDPNPEHLSMSLKKSVPNKSDIKGNQLQVDREIFRREQFSLPNSFVAVCCYKFLSDMRLRGTLRDSVLTIVPPA